MREIKIFSILLLSILIAFSIFLLFHHSNQMDPKCYIQNLRVFYLENHKWILRIFLTHVFQSFYPKALILVFNAIEPNVFVWWLILNIISQLNST